LTVKIVSASSRALPLFLACACTGAFASMPTLALAADEAATPATPAAAADENVLASTRRTMRSTTEWLASGVDGLFGDRAITDGDKVSDGELTPYVLTRQGEKPDIGVRFNARVRLPNLEHHAYLFVGRDDPRAVITDTPGTFSTQQRALPESSTESTFFAGLGVRLFDNAVQLRLGLRSGVKPYAQARYLHGWTLSPDDRAEFRETVFWTKDDRFGSTTVLSYEHAITPMLAARWLNAATITQNVSTFARSSGVGLYQGFEGQRLLSLEALYSSVLPSGREVSNEGLQVKWAQPIHEDWIIGEVLVGHFWTPQAPPGDRKQEWAFGLSAKMKF
jgi:hypothetical protein